MRTVYAVRPLHRITVHPLGDVRFEAEELASDGALVARRLGYVKADGGVFAWEVEPMTPAQRAVFTEIMADLRGRMASYPQEFVILEGPRYPNLFGPLTIGGTVEQDVLVGMAPVWNNVRDELFRLGYDVVKVGPGERLGVPVKIIAVPFGKVPIGPLI